MEHRLKKQPIWLWRYLENERNYPGLNFTAKGEACVLLKQLTEKLAAEGGGTRLIGLSALDPKDEAKVSGGLRFVAFEKLRLTISPRSADLQHMWARYAGSVVTLEFTLEFLPRFWEGITDVASGHRDWSIAPPEGRRARGVAVGAHDAESLGLTFWPCFGHLCEVP